MRACCFLFCLGEAAVAVGGPSARSNATEVLGTLSPAPPRTAFLVVGAAYDIRNDVLQRYVENVVKPYGGQTRTFALVKAIHWDGKPYDDATTAKLAAMVQKTLRPTDSVVSNKDPTTVARFGNVSQDAIDCLWPRKGHGKFSEGLTLPPVAGYDKSPTIETCRKRFVYWWGAMQLAHDMMAKHEARNGTTPFESVIFVRVGVDVLSPIPHFAKIRRDAIYTHRDVPDTFWVMPRAAAAAMLQTTDATVKCVETPGCCVAMRDCRFKWRVPNALFETETSAAPFIHDAGRGSSRASGRASSGWPSRSSGGSASLRTRTSGVTSPAAFGTRDPTSPRRRASAHPTPFPRREGSRLPAAAPQPRSSRRGCAGGRLDRNKKSLSTPFAFGRAVER